MVVVVVVGIAGLAPAATQYLQGYLRPRASAPPRSAWRGAPPDPGGPASTAHYSARPPMFAVSPPCDPLLPAPLVSVRCFFGDIMFCACFPIAMSPLISPAPRFSCSSASVRVLFGSPRSSAAPPLDAGRPRFLRGASPLTPSCLLSASGPSASLPTATRSARLARLVRRSRVLQHHSCSARAAPASAPGVQRQRTPFIRTPLCGSALRCVSGRRLRLPHHPSQSPQ